MESVVSPTSTSALDFNTFVAFYGRHLLTYDPYSARVFGWLAPMSPGCLDVNELDRLLAGVHTHLSKFQQCIVKSLIHRFVIAG